jgi:hypothetical protein
MTSANRGLGDGLRRAASLLGLAVFLGLSAAASAVAASGPYEPNDALPAAAGPLAPGQAYAGAIEAAGDKDIFAFYVTSAAPAQVKLAVRNLGGGDSLAISDVDVAIVDSLGSPIASLPYILDGEERAAAVTLSPQKYYLEIWSNEGFGDSYSFTTAGGAGAFGPYAQIAGRCGAGTQAAKAARNQLSHAETRLQRAVSRVRRSRYASKEARALARERLRQTRRQVRAARVAIRDAAKSQQPWCSIPQ